MKLQISLDSMFGIFKEIEEYVPKSNLIEISVRQHRISLYLRNDDIIYLSDVLNLCHDVLVNPEDTIITPDEKGFYILIEEIPDEVNQSSKFKELVQVIRYMAEHICQCPALEYVISSHYIKCFLDKPGIKLSEIQKMEELFGEECTLELSAGRPYALFINTNFEL